MHIITAPLMVARNKTRNVGLNLNIYRNSHFQVLNDIKKKYKEQLYAQIQQLPVYTSIKLKYVLYPKTKRLCDISNILSIHDKFFCDALVELGKLPDDDYRYLRKIQYEFGEIDKDNPRVEILIYEDVP